MASGALRRGATARLEIPHRAQGGREAAVGRRSKSPAERRAQNARRPNGPGKFYTDTVDMFDRRTCGTCMRIKPAKEGKIHKSTFDKKYVYEVAEDKPELHRESQSKRRRSQSRRRGEAKTKARPV